MTSTSCTPRDLTTPLEETLRALDDLQRAGQSPLLSALPTPWPGGSAKTLWASDRLRITPIVSEQASYSLFDRALEAEVLPFCRTYGIAVIAYGSLAGGWLSGRYHRGQPPPPESRLAVRGTMVGAADEARAFDVLERLAPLAADKGITLGQLALAWLLAQPGVTTALIGPRTVGQLHDNLGALAVPVTPVDLAAIDEIVPPGTKVVPEAPAPGAMLI